MRSPFEMSARIHRSLRPQFDCALLAGFVSTAFLAACAVGASAIADEDGALSLVRDTVIDSPREQAPNGVLAQSPRDVVVWYADTASLYRWQGGWARIEGPRIGRLVDIALVGTRLIAIDSLGGLSTGQLAESPTWSAPAQLQLRTAERVESMAADRAGNHWISLRQIDSTIRVSRVAEPGSALANWDQEQRWGGSTLTVGVDSGSLLLAEVTPPFRLALISEGKPTLVIDSGLALLTEAQDAATSEPTLWRLMRPVRINSGFLMTLTDLRSLRRLIVRVDRNLQFQSCRIVVAPFGLAAATPDGDAVVAGQWDTRSQLAIYRVEVGSSPPRRLPGLECKA